MPIPMNSALEGVELKRFDVAQEEAETRDLLTEDDRHQFIAEGSG